MSLFDMYFRDGIKSPSQPLSTASTVDEFDNLGARMSAWALREHNEDGTHNVRPSGFDFVPIGSMVIWPAALAPSGWLLCDGSQVSRTTYVTLFSLLGTSYGAGDGITTFNLPDLRQRFPLGKAAAGTGSNLGDTGGAIDHTHTLSGSVSATGSTSTDGSHTHGGSTGSGGSHNHTATTSSDGSHSHSVTGSTNDGSNVTDFAQTTNFGIFSSDSGHTHTVTGSTDTQGSHNHSLTTSTDGSHAHSISADGSHSHTVSVSGSLSGTSGSNNPPFQVFNYIIAAGV